MIKNQEINQKAKDQADSNSSKYITQTKTRYFIYKWCRGWDLNHKDFSFPKENPCQKKGLYFGFLGFPYIISP